MTSQTRRAVLFDVDGTLVDSTYFHVVAFWRAFHDVGIEVPMRDIHRRIGMGADRLVRETLRREDERVVDGHTEHFAPFLDLVTALPGAVDLLTHCTSRGLTVVLATSASATEVEAQKRALAGSEEAVEAITSSEDAEESKPDPDILQAALAKAGLDAADCVFVGDAEWDVRAARELGIPCVALLTGGMGPTELLNAGAIDVYDGPAALLEAFDVSPLGRLAAGEAPPAPGEPVAA
jgi:HAD superfamily hydrolase (TIGR01549 family)